MTSGNAGHGLDRFQALGRIFPRLGIWCSDGAPLSLCCFGGVWCWGELRRYVVMGWSWTWLPVHPYDCDRIAGTIPDAPAASSPTLAKPR
ncbi:hypothetical protein [Micromonospora echinofusca]|uniref:hypothetical protein n=1 Tax=Micromonospora echinofusca TaxID=47858 RepID=UPI0012FD215D|nr:hypothetical protein [Micromonospora echinofusca]